MNISPAVTLKPFVDAELDRRGFGSSSAYVVSLIHREQEREASRTLLPRGAASPVGSTSSDDFRFKFFYREAEGRIEVWRVLHKGRDIGATLLDLDT